MTTNSIIGLCGSLRAKSFNLYALKAAGEVMPAGMTLSIATYDDMPIYNQDIQDKGWPESVNRIRDQIAAADAVVIANPEYNWSVGAPLKNVIDWLSRMKDNPFQNKPVSMISATGGPVGGVRGQLDLRRILTILGSHVLVKPEVFIGNAASKFSPEGKLTDDTTRKFMTEQMVSLQDLIARVKRANG